MKGSPPGWPAADLEDAVGVLVAQREALDQGHMADWALRLAIADELAYVLRESE